MTSPKWRHKSRANRSPQVGGNSTRTGAVLYLRVDVGPSRKVQLANAELVFYQVSRFSRNAEDWAVQGAALARLGIKLSSTSENLSNDPHGRFLGKVFVGLAELDNETKGVDARTAHQDAHLPGRRGQRSRPVRCGCRAQRQGGDGRCQDQDDCAARKKPARI